MTRSKKIFVLIAAVFLLLLLYVSYDFSKRTTFPGRKNQGNGEPAIQKNDRSIEDSVRKAPEK